MLPRSFRTITKIWPENVARKYLLGIVLVTSGVLGVYGAYGYVRAARDDATVVIHRELHAFPTWIPAGDREYSIELNVADNTQSQLKRWLEHVNQKVAWIFVSDRVVKVHLLNVSLKEPGPDHFPPLRLAVTFRADAQLTESGDFGVFSFHPTLRQTWRLSEDSVETSEGSFRIRYSAADLNAEFVTYGMTIQRKIGAQGWRTLHSWSDQGASWTVDLTGDGVPEIIGATGYKDIGLWQVYPTFRELIVNRSGV